MARPRKHLVKETTRRLKMSDETAQELLRVGDIHGLSQRKIMEKVYDFVASLKDAEAEQYVLGTLKPGFLEAGREALVRALEKRDRR